MDFSFLELGGDFAIHCMSREEVLEYSLALKEAFGKNLFHSISDNPVRDIVSFNLDRWDDCVVGGYKNRCDVLANGIYFSLHARPDGRITIGWDHNRGFFHREHYTILEFSEMVPVPEVDLTLIYC